MKLKLKSNGKVVREVIIPNKLHFEIQKNTRANVFKNKKAYTRKNKHKKDYNDET